MRVPGMTQVTHLYVPAPLPGVVIFVHGVNSSGEWYDATEQGLCEGINQRLGRAGGHWGNISHSGQSRPAVYAPELNANGTLRDENNSSTFIADHGRSPVIRFRWGYRANKEDLDQYSDKIWLDEQEAWGGGPFQNGCSSLPDLWAEGLNDRLFLWIRAQMLNPVPGRDVYACPPRHYFVHAAYRLAKLIEQIRTRQADCPITVVAHSQDNIVTLAAAFLGEGMTATDGDGATSKALADTYILCNPPYSLIHNGLEDWTLRYSRNAASGSGGQTDAARAQTLGQFIKHVDARKGLGRSPEKIGEWLGQWKGEDKDGWRLGSFWTKPPAAGADRDNRGRVFLYCNPHDQVISAASVQGIGWRGVTDAQCAVIDPARQTFYQRVWAQDIKVGDPARDRYHYWQDHWNGATPQNKGYWSPASPPARFSLTATPGRNWVAQFFATLTAPIMYAVTSLTRLSINAEPPHDHAVPVNAPALAEPLAPQGRGGSPFDAGLDRARDEPDQARQNYEYRARLKLAENRGGLGVSPDAGDDEKNAARERLRQRYLQEETNATDHSTILSNPLHAEKILARDVAVGVCTLRGQDWYNLRQYADWRWVDKDDPEGFPQYYKKGYFKDKTLAEVYPKSGMPAGIVDERVWPEQRGGGDGNP